MKSTVKIEKPEKLSADKMVVVDLYSGSFNNDRRGHEALNLQENEDGNYYGYCPPLDGVNIKRLGADHNDTYIDGILVVYVAKKKNSNNREIIAFCQNARTYNSGQPVAKLNRSYEDTNEKTIKPTYSIKSDNLMNLEYSLNKFEIEIGKYNSYMFRHQRFYGGKYPELDKRIILYIEHVLSKQQLDNDDGSYQDTVQNANSVTDDEADKSADKKLNIGNNSHCKVINKNSGYSKTALINAGYVCALDHSHNTFTTSHNTPYMEGHHLIPCTVTNSVLFKKNFDKNIDCVQNIVCLCPTCHREIHYGEWETKSKKIIELYKLQKEELKKVGIYITEEELLDLYK